MKNIKVVNMENEIIESMLDTAVHNVIVRLINGTEELFERTTVKIKDDLYYFNLSTVELWDSIERKYKPALEIHHKVNLSDGGYYDQTCYDREITNIEDTYLVVRKKNKTLLFNIAI